MKTIKIASAHPRFHVMITISLECDILDWGVKGCGPVELDKKFKLLMSKPPSKKTNEWIISTVLAVPESH